MATHWTLGCDARDPHRLAAFWATALGYRLIRAKVLELGASVVREVTAGDVLDHVVMLDPEGTEFCVA